MSDARKAVKQAINETLWRIHELEATVSDFNGDQALLDSRIAQVAEELRKLQSHREALDVKVPLELLTYVDEGGNPDAYTTEVFLRANRANQLSKGKAEAFKSFRDALREEIQAAYPEQAAAYKAVLEQGETSEAPTAQPFTSSAP